MKLGTIQYKGQPRAIIKGSDGNPRLLSKVCEASNLKPIHNLLDFIEGNNQKFLQCMQIQVKSIVISKIMNAIKKCKRN